MEPSPTLRQRNLPGRVRDFLERIPPSDHEKVYAVLADDPEITRMVKLTLLVGRILRRAPRAMIRGRLTSREYLEGLASLRRLIQTLERRSHEFSSAIDNRAGNPDFETDFESTYERGGAA